MSSRSNGENNLPILLASMRPTVHPETFVFLTTRERIESLPLQLLKPEMLFQEEEGLSIITTKDLAESNGFRDYTFPCKKISLAVHSSLEAVGLIAAISSKLASHGISTNVVSGYFHDHIFVPLGKEDAALQVLQDMMQAAESTIEK